MTSIVCWINKEDGDVLWAVSDSRVSGQNGIMTDNCPKMSKITAVAYQADDYLKSTPVTILSFGFAFAGSTLIGTNVKEMLSTLLSDLQENMYYDNESIPLADKIPSLLEIATLVKVLGEKYIFSLGQFYPSSAKCEFVVFGFCRRTASFHAYKVSNSFETQTELRVTSEQIDDGSCLILGDQKEPVLKLIDTFKAKFDDNTMNWWRSPFLALHKMIREDSKPTIGGNLQFMICTSIGAKLLFVSSINKFNPSIAGFDLYSDIGSIGGFTAGGGHGMSLPGDDGW